MAHPYQAKAQLPIKPWNPFSISRMTTLQGKSHFQPNKKAFAGVVVMGIIH